MGIDELRDELAEAARDLVHEHCREELGEAHNWERCNRPAEFILWGKLIAADGLGPRCYEHAEEHVGGYGLMPEANYALLDLRPLRRALGMTDPGSFAS